MPEVCIMDTVISQDKSPIDTLDGNMTYFGGLGTVMAELCSNIINKSGSSLRGNNFNFEWFTKQKVDQLNVLIEKNDETLTPLECKYTITTK